MRSRGLCARKTGLSEQRAELEQLGRATGVVRALQRAKPVPRLQQRIWRVPEGDRRRPVDDTDHAAWFQHTPYFAERRERHREMLKQCASEGGVE